MNEGPTSLARPLERALPVTGIYAAATFVFTFPLGLRLRSHVPAGTGDIWQNLWNLWWWKKALLELGTSPFYTSQQFHPVGTSLAFHTHSPLNALASLPLQALFGLEAAYDLLLLSGFVFAALGAYLLVRDLTGEPRAAFVAGILYAFTPLHFEQSLEHLNLASIQFLPFCVFFLRRLVRDGGNANLLACALAFAANALVSWQYGALAAPIALAVAMREVAARPREPGRLSLELLGAALIAGALVAPFAWPMLREVLAGTAPPPKSFAHRSTDLAFWLLPNGDHPLLGWLTRDLYTRYRPYPGVGFVSYLGIAPVSLALLALASRRFGGDRRWFYGAWLGGFLLLSLGAHPTLLGHVYENVTLPHALFEGTPFLRMFRVANRFALVATLGLAVLAGAALAALFRARRARLAWALALVVALEYLWLPYPTQPARVHPYVEELALDSDAGAILPIPLPVHSQFSVALYDQTRHGRPIVGGYVSYPSPKALSAIRASPFLRGLVRRGGRPGPIDPQALSAHGVGTVLVHLDRGTGRKPREALDAAAVVPPDPWLAGVAAVVERALGPPIYRDEELLVFRVPGRGAPAGGDPSLRQ